MNVLVTGATGFIGNALAHRLRLLGHHVRATGRNPAARVAFAAAGVEFVPAELANASALTALAAGRDWVFHCGARSTPWGTRQEFHESNVLGTAHLLEACRAQGVRRFIHVSSASVCMRRCDQLNLRETDPLPAHPINEYARSKRFAEGEVQAAVQRGLSAIILRPQAVYGPGDRAIFPRIVRLARKGILPAFGRDPLLDVTYIDNFVDAAILAAENADLPSGRVYHVSNGEPWKLSRLLETLFAALHLRVRRPNVPYVLGYSAAAALEGFYRVLHLHGEPRLTRYAVDVLTYSRTLDISRARQELGYTPRVTVADGLDRFVKEDAAP